MKIVKKIIRNLILTICVFTTFCVLLAIGVTLAVDHWGHVHTTAKTTVCDDQGHCTSQTTNK